MLCDDSPEHPVCFFLRLKLSGRCERAAMDAALARAIARHPLLAATVVLDGRNVWHWQPNPDALPTVQWRTEFSSGEQTGSLHIDLHKQLGVAVFGCSRSSSVELLFQFHHSCCDGIGALQFIEDLLHVYRQALDQADDGDRGQRPQPAWRRIDPQHLAHRHKFGLTRWQLLNKVRKQAVSLFGVWQFLNRTPTKLVSSPPAASLSEPPRLYPAALAYDFSVAETESLLATARTCRTTLNNLLIRDLLLAIGDFRNADRGGDDRQWLRLSIPINLRRSDGDNLSAANVVSMVFVDRQFRELNDHQLVLQSIHSQMQQIKDLELGLTFPLSLRIAKWLPGGGTRMRRMAKEEHCRCTAVLSNLMRPLSEPSVPRRDGKVLVGDCVLEGIEFLPPVRQGTQASFGVVTYAGRLNISIHYDSRIMTSADAHELLIRFTDYLQRSAQNSVPSYVAEVAKI